MATVEKKTEFKVSAKSGAEVKVKAKKGMGPLVVMYLDREGKPSKKPTENVAQVEIADRGGRKTTMAIDGLSPNTRNQLVALAVGKRIDTFVRNSVKGDDKANIIQLADGIFSSIKSGVIFKRGESKRGAAGRPFDYDLWIEVMATVTMRKTKKPASKIQLDAFRSKLNSMQGADRRNFILGLQRDPHVSVAVKELQAAKEAQKLASGEVSDYDALADMK